MQLFFHLWKNNVDLIKLECYNFLRRGEIMNYSHKNFVERLQKAKSIKKLRVEDICKASGVPIGTVSKIFAGITVDPKVSTVIAIANALNTNIDYLVYGKESFADFTDSESALIKKYRQLDVDGREDVDDYVDMKLAQIQRKSEDAGELLG